MAAHDWPTGSIPKRGRIARLQTVGHNVRGRRVRAQTILIDSIISSGCMAAVSKRYLLTSCGGPGREPQCPGDLALDATCGAIPRLLCSSPSK